MMTVDSFIEKITYLPPMPRNVVSLLDLLSNPEVDIEQVVQLVQYDPALTAQVLRLCNSAYFGGAPASDLHEATARLGFNEIIQLVTALSTARLVYPQQKGYGIEAGELWKHSVATALVGKFLAVDRGDNAATVFTACILHDLGKVVLSRNLEGKYQQIIDEVNNTHSPMIAVEQKLLGFDHTQVGGRLLERWQFPGDLVEAVRFHHEPAKAPNHARIAAYAYLGNMIASFMGYCCGHQALALQGQTEALELTGIRADQIPKCMTQVFYALRDTMALLNFPF